MGDSVLDRLRDRPPSGTAILFPKTGVRLHAMLTTAGTDHRTARPYDWHGLKRGEAPFVLMQHTLSGRGRLRFEGREMSVGPGRTMLLHFPHDHRYWLAPGDSWEFFWICLNGREPLRLWREMLAAAGPLVSLPDAALDRLAGLCLSILDGEAATASRASELAYAVAMVLAEHLLAPGQAPTEQSLRPVTVARAVARAEGSVRAGERLDVTRLAEAAGLSRHHFSRVFAASEGLPPARFLLRHRMEQAALLLRTEPASVKDVALRCGFADANYFAKAFRRVYAISPSDFRRSLAFGR